MLSPLVAQRRHAAMCVRAIKWPRACSPYASAHALACAHFRKGALVRVCVHAYSPHNACGVSTICYVVRFMAAVQRFILVCVYACAFALTRLWSMMSACVHNHKNGVLSYACLRVRAAQRKQSPGLNRNRLKGADVRGQMPESGIVTLSRVPTRIHMCACV